MCPQTLKIVVLPYTPAGFPGSFQSSGARVEQAILELLELCLRYWALGFAVSLWRYVTCFRTGQQS